MNIGITLTQHHSLGSGQEATETNAESMGCEMTETENQLLQLLADIRKAAGDEKGHLMQHELIDHIKRLKAASDKLEKIEKARIDWEENANETK
ncbi:MAG: hypothetical protein E6Q83_03765 [Thiothrix sp.]|nr:MAG: hypothetical protein E6Q83_03765 [Thiothrix sp.]